MHLGRRQSARNVRSGLALLSGPQFLSRGKFFSSQQSSTLFTKCTRSWQTYSFMGKRSFQTTKYLPSPTKRTTWLLAGGVAAVAGAVLAQPVSAEPKEEEVTMAEDVLSGSVQEKEGEDDLSDEELVDTLMAMPILVILSDATETTDEFEQKLDEIVDQVQEVHISDYHYFVDDKKGYFPLDAPAAIYYHNPKSSDLECYLFPKDRQLDVQSLRQFLEEIKQGKADRFYPSEPRPPRDLHPRSKTVFMATTASFKEVVLDAKQDVLVRLAMPSSSVAPPVDVLSRVYEEDKSLKVVTMNSFVNVPDPKYFADNKVSVWKFFPASDKEHPLTYVGPGDPFDIIKWIASIRKEPGQLIYSRMKKANHIYLERDIETAMGKWFLYSFLYKDFYASPEQRRANEVQNKLKKVYAALLDDKDPYKVKIQRLKKELDAALEALENKVLKRAVKIADEDFEKELQQARTKGGKVVVFFWRDGCLPCLNVNKYVGALSETMPDVTFLKVNARVLKLPSTPTFYVYEGDKEEKLNLRQFKALTDNWLKQRGLPLYGLCFVS
jgi:thiol-disulfide isomerase/thioredoxin/translation elongation factor EF-1beta